MKPYKYHYRRYNEFDVVRVNLFTILAAIYMARHALGLLFIGMALRGGRSGKIEAKGAFDGLIEPIYITADIPAMAVLLAMICRHPKSAAPRSASSGGVRHISCSPRRRSISPC